MRNLKNIFIAFVALSVMGLAVNALAYGGRGNRGGAYCPGYDGRGYNNQMSPEEIEQFQNERDAFFKATEGLRNDLYDRQNLLQSELAKENPDLSKASKLQKEISDLRGELDQKRLDHVVKMRKLNPNAGRGYMGRGYNMQGGPMMGYGPRGGGYCWR